MGNQVQKMRERELTRKLEKRRLLTDFLTEGKRNNSVFEQAGLMPNALAAQRLLPEGADRLQALEAAHLLGDGLIDDGEGGLHQLTDREREAWLYRMENEALEVINDNMELQEERRRERERRDERRDELENLGADTGLGYFDHGDLGRDDPTMNREDLYDREDHEEERHEEVEQQRSGPSSRRSSPAASLADDEDDDDENLEEVDFDDDFDEDEAEQSDASADADDYDDEPEADDEPEPEPEPEPEQEDAGGDY